MNNPKARKACSNCYQKKVRCHWKEDSPRCTYCDDHDLQCSIPDAGKTVQRTSIRETLKDFEARLHRLERQADNVSQVSPDGSNPLVVSSHSASSEVEASLDARWVTQDVYQRELNSAQGEDFSQWSSLTPTKERSAAGPADEILGRGSDSRYVAEVPWIDNPTADHVGDSRLYSVQAYRGNISPWNILVDGVKAASMSNADSPFNMNMMRLADEDRSTMLKSNRISWNILQEIPHLTRELVFTYTKDYARDAPFPIVCWQSFEKAIGEGLRTGTWSRWGELVCVLLYMAFGSAHLNISSPNPEGQICFQHAWTMLPQLLLEQGLWSLKGLTLMVHYLQAGALPEPCYTLIGSASRMAISLGFHTGDARNINNFNSIEEEEGKRSWWLCYVMEKTLSVILGRPSTNLDNPNTDLPKPYDITQHSEVSEGDDQEAVNLYYDIITTARLRESILHKPTLPLLASETIEEKAERRRLLLLNTISELRTSSVLKRPVDFMTSKPNNLRASICDLCYYNSIIVISRHLDQDFISPESIKAARASIMVISENHQSGMIMCLWMWLYYGFSATIPLFLSVLQNPLSSSAPLHLALIADMETLCKGLAASSPGAKRVMEVTGLMGKVGFEAVKSRAKRKAEEELEADRREKRVEVEAEDGADESANAPADETGSLEHIWPPDTFSWDDWDQWLTSSMPSPS